MGSHPRLGFARVTVAGTIMIPITATGMTPIPRFARRPESRGSSPSPSPICQSQGSSCSTIECRISRGSFTANLQLELAISKLKFKVDFRPRGNGAVGYGGTVTVLGDHTSNAASEARGYHSIAQLIMSELHWQTSMGDGILQMIVCLRRCNTVRYADPETVVSASTISSMEGTIAGP
jgi:hypothetical protein